MYPVSEAYKTAIRARTRTDRVTGTLTLTDGTVLPLTAAELMSGSLTLDNQCVTGEELAFGCAYLGQAALNLRTALSRHAFYGARLCLAYGLQLPDGRTVLLVDTVGLIRRLPHHLVQAFHATLEEAATADLVLNLCDASSPDAAEHLAITGTLLSDLGRGELPVLQVFNKCDRLTAENADIALPPRTADGGERLYISAKTGEGIDKLLAAIAAALPRDREKVTVLLPFSAGALAETCRREGAVESEEYVPEGLRMTVTVDKRLLHQLKAAGATFFEE